MKNAHVVGDKIYLRPLERSDAPILQPWFNDPEVTEQLAIRRPVSLDFEDEFLSRLANDEHRVVLGVCAKNGDALIGTVGLEEIDFINRAAQFGICIGVKTEWNRGCGTEATRLMVDYAFGRLNLNRVCLNVYATNARGLRVYEKVGFKKEGVLRQARWQSTAFVDTIVMGVLREEWRSGTVG